MKNNLLLAILFIACLASPNAGQSKHSEPSRPAPTPSPAANQGIKVDVKGSFEGSTYTNAALGFTITMPEGWQVQDNETQTQFAARATERSSTYGQGKPGTAAGLERTAILFMLVRPTETPTNPIVIGIAEDIALAFNVRTPEQYLMAARTNGADPAIDFDTITTSEKINGADFAWMGAKPKNPNSHTYLRYYVTLRKHHAIVFVLTFHRAEELQWCLDVLTSLKFE